MNTLPFSLRLFVTDGRFDGMGFAGALVGSGYENVWEFRGVREKVDPPWRLAA